MTSTADQSQPNVRPRPPSTYFLARERDTNLAGRQGGGETARTLSAADARKADCEHAELCTNYLKILVIFTRHRGDKEEATPDSGASHV